MQDHNERIAELRATYQTGVVEPHIHFSQTSARFRVKLGGKWQGTYWTLVGARNALKQLKIKKIETQITDLQTQLRKLEGSE